MNKPSRLSGIPAWLKGSPLLVGGTLLVARLFSGQNQLAEEEMGIADEVLVNVSDKRMWSKRVLESSSPSLAMPSLPPSFFVEEQSTSNVECSQLLGDRAHEYSFDESEQLSGRVPSAFLDSFYDYMDGGCQLVDTYETENFVATVFSPLGGLNTEDKIEIPIFPIEEESDGVLLNHFQPELLNDFPSADCARSRFKNALSTFSVLDIPLGWGVSEEDANMLEYLLSVGYEADLADDYLIFDSSCSFVERYQKPGSKVDIFSLDPVIHFSREDVLASSSLPEYLERVSPELLQVEFEHFLDKFKGEEKELLEGAYFSILAPLFSDLEEGGEISIDSICLSLSYRKMFLAEYPEFEENDSFDLLDRLYGLMELHMVFNTVDSKGCDGGEA